MGNLKMKVKYNTFKTTVKKIKKTSKFYTGVDVKISDSSSEFKLDDKYSSIDDIFENI